MPRVHIQKAGKDYPNINVLKGTTYYWWKFRYGGKHRSATYPRPSQLTQSKMSAAYAASEALEDAIFNAVDAQVIADALGDASTEIEDVKTEYEESLENMVSQEGQIAEEIQEKIDGLEEWVQNIDAAKDEVESLEDFGEDEDDVSKNGAEALLEAAKDAAGNATDSPL
jgi:hypothetical protein